MKPIDFSYSFAPPNRLTVCRPDSPYKLLCDCSEEGIQASWSEKAVRDVAYDGLFEPLPGTHKIRFQAFDGDQPLPGSRWRRLEGWLPVLDYTYGGGDCTVRCQAAGGRIGDILRVTAQNCSNVRKEILFRTRCTSLFNRLWTKRGSPHNALTGNMYFPPERIVLYSPQRCEPSDIFNIELRFTLEPGQSETDFVIRPYDSWMKDADTLAATDWQRAFDDAVTEWKTLIGRAAPITLPDPDLQQVYLACLADMFVMREPQKSGHVVGLCGTELYRCTNAGEPLFMTGLLVKLGYLAEALDGMQFSLGCILPDGNWNEPDRWPHDGWVCGGFKSLAVMEYYRVTGDAAFLRTQFERMLASARYNDRVRQTTKVGERTAEWGLMPRGMGDGGLLDGTDMYGVFYPHNFYCYTGARLTLEAAELLGRTDVIDELRGMVDDYADCLCRSLETGAVTDPDGVRWIGSVPGKASGSRWSVVDAAYPCELLEADDPLIDGTVRAITRNLSEGGLPLDLGWMKGGIWAAIAIDSLTYVSILRGETRRMTDYLYAVANHATPLVSWCEERMPEPQAQKRSGDLQHSWTPIAVCKTVIASAAFSFRNTLYLGCGYDRDWKKLGRPMTAQGLRTNWGKTDFELSAGKTMRLTVRMEERLPEIVRTRGRKVLNCTGCTCAAENGWIVISPKEKEFSVEFDD